MDDARTSQLDALALVWLLIKKNNPRTDALATAIGPILEEPPHEKALGTGTPQELKEKRKVVTNFIKEALARFKAQGLIKLKTTLRLNENGQKRALELLGIHPPPRADFRWVKRVFALRALGHAAKEASKAAQDWDGSPGWLPALILAQHYQLANFQRGMTLAEVGYALAWRSLERDEKVPFDPNHILQRFFIQAELPARIGEQSGVLDADPLGGFVRGVKEAAETSTTGRWTGNKIFISHLWREFQRKQGTTEMTLQDFKRRLLDANRHQLIELGGADLVQAMPPDDVAASETASANATFHFLRLDERRNHREG